MDHLATVWIEYDDSAGECLGGDTGDSRLWSIANILIDRKTRGDRPLAFDVEDSLISL